MPRDDNLPPEMRATLHVMDSVYRAFDRIAIPQPQQRFRHPLDPVIGDAVEKIEAAALSLLMLRDGINGALLRGEDPGDIVRQIPGGARRTRDALDDLVRELPEVG